jgi:hypothetical protein
MRLPYKICGVIFTKCDVYLSFPVPLYVEKGFLSEIYYSGASVYELNPFLEAVRNPKCS